MSPAASRWLTVLLVCCLYLGVRAIEETESSLVGALLRFALPLLIGMALVLAALSSLGWID